MRLRVLGASLVAAAVSVTSVGRAQSESELRAGRELFQDAYRDEQDRRYPEALEKFQRVARVKETGAVRYRIASVLSAMGRLREARDLFRVLAHAPGANDADIADSAAEEAAQLGRKIPKLALTIVDAPADARVMIDGAPVPVAARATFELDPGEHVVAASVGARIVHETTLHLAEGDAVKHVISFERRGPDKALGIVGIGAGTALVVTSGVLLALRESAIGRIEDACPGNVCPASSRAAVESDRDRANLYRPLALGLGIGGIVAVGFGVYLLAARVPSMTSRSAPASARSRFACSMGMAFDHLGFVF